MVVRYMRAPWSRSFHRLFRSMDPRSVMLPVTAHRVGRIRTWGDAGHQSARTAAECGPVRAAAAASPRSKGVGPARLSPDHGVSTEPRMAFRASVLRRRRPTERPELEPDSTAQTPRPRVEHRRRTCRPSAATRNVRGRACPDRGHVDACHRHPGLGRELLEGKSFPSSASFEAWLLASRRHLAGAAEGVPRGGAGEALDG